jgi:hypothetical protein
MRGYALTTLAIVAAFACGIVVALAHAVCTARSTRWMSSVRRAAKALHDRAARMTPARAAARVRRGGACQCVVRALPVSASRSRPSDPRGLGRWTLTHGVNLVIIRRGRGHRHSRRQPVHREPSSSGCRTGTPRATSSGSGERARSGAILTSLVTVTVWFLRAADAAARTVDRRVADP